MEKGVITCKGSYLLGSACGHCPRCDEERAKMQKVHGTEVPNWAMVQAKKVWLQIIPPKSPLGDDGCPNEDGVEVAIIASALMKAREKRVRKKISFELLVDLMMKGHEVTLATGDGPSVELYLDTEYDDYPADADEAADRVRDEWENNL